MITIFISSAKSTTRSISSSTIIYSKFSTYETSTMTLSTTIVSSTYMPSTKPPYETTQLSTVSTLTSLVTSTIKPSTTAETSSTKVSTLIGHSTTGLPIRPSTSKESRLTKVSSPTSPSSTMVSTYMTSLLTVIETIDNSLIFSSATSPSFSETYFTEGDFFKWLFNQFCI